jgi:PleD family two-component response regulator
VKQSRGHIKLYSEVGEGTTVKVYLPRAHAIEASAEQETDEPVVRGTPNETILVVDDDADLRTYSCETLRALGYNVVEAEHGRMALELLGRYPEVRVLFTDTCDVLNGGQSRCRPAPRTRRPRQRRQL